MKFDCEHDNGWIGSPPGFLPVSWKCIDCGASMTSGEMIIWVKLAKQIRDIKNGLDALDSQCSHVQIDESSP